MLADEPPLTGDPHPEIWDLICVGTGLAETMLASAAARAGKSVLHLDPADAYGGAFGALAESSGGVGWDVPSSADLERQAAMYDGRASDPGVDEDFEDAIAFPALGAPVDARTRLGATSYCSPAAPSGSTRRHFSLDRSGPRVALGADAFVDVLVRSGAHKYVEFKAVDATAMFSRDAGFVAVPASRAEVFRDQTLSLAEKRALMRVLKHTVRVAQRDGRVVGAGDPDSADAAVGAPGSEWRAAGDAAEDAARPRRADDRNAALADAPAPLYAREDESFALALERLGLGRNTRASLAVQFALALSGDDAEPARRGFESLTTYLASLHRFGPEIGAALVPLYGAGEFPQAFARLAAVHGATCALRVGARRALFRTRRPTEDGPSEQAEATERASAKHADAFAVVVTAGGQRLRCRALAAAAAAIEKTSLASETSQGAPTRWISRMTAVVDGACAFFPNETNQSATGETPSTRGARQTALAVFPPGSVRGAPAGAAIRVARLGSATGAAPRGPRDGPTEGGWWVLQASVASHDRARSAEDDLGGVLELLADTASLRGYVKKEAETRSAAPATGKARLKPEPTPRATWVCFHREVAPDDARAVVASWSALPRNVVTCPGPDARADFADLVAVAEAAFARLWGGEASASGVRLFPATPRAPGSDGGADAAAEHRGTRTEDSDEDDMDALLRDLPGGIGA